MPELYWITYGVNYLGLILALWLGLYLVSRNPRFPIAWLTALTLWSLTGVFLNILLAISPPPQMGYHLPWLRFLFPFWPAGSATSSTNIWLQGWSVVPAVAFWHHVTALMLPGKFSIWRWTRVLLGYFLAVVAVVWQANSPFVFSVREGNPLFLNSLKTGIWYPIFWVALALLILACVLNLVGAAQRSQGAMVRRQLRWMAIATLVAGLSALLIILGVARELAIPMVTLSLLIALPVVMIGIGMVRYSAFMQGHTIRHDFFYNLLLLSLLVLIYWSACGILVAAYRAPPVIMVLIPVLAVLTHSLMTPVLRLMDHLVYRGETRRLRLNLRSLLRLAGEGNNLEANLGRALQNICRSVRATFGVILIFEKGNLRKAAACGWNYESVDWKQDPFRADDVIHLPPGHFKAPLDEAALLVPLYGDSEQLGALLLGRPVNGLRYSDDEVDSLLNSTDRIGEIIFAARRKAENLAQINRLAEAQRVLNAVQAAPLPVEEVENALRNLYDYAFLADTPLAHMNLVSRRLSEGQVTHLERGKIVYEILLEAIDKLNPGSAVSSTPPPRDAYPYLILHQAYVEQVSNRDIMQRLYISEGTFNRTRRSAVRSLARALGEMEAALA